MRRTAWTPLRLEAALPDSTTDQGVGALVHDLALHPDVVGVRTLPGPTRLEVLVRPDARDYVEHLVQAHWEAWAARLAGGRA